MLNCLAIKDMLAKHPIKFVQRILSKIDKSFWKKSNWANTMNSISESELKHPSLHSVINSL